VAPLAPGDTTPLRTGSVALVGFDEESFSDAALALSRLGYAASRAETIQAAASSNGFVLVDELLFDEGDDALVESLASKLVIATRLGGDIRSRLERDGIAFAPIPLRSSDLRCAFAALANYRAPGPGSVEHESKSPSVGITPAGRGILARLATALEKLASHDAYADAEREAKDAQGALIAAGDTEGSKLAFTALLSIRKGDISAIKTSIARIRGVAKKDGP
jgi:hypothetical protein